MSSKQLNFFLTPDDYEMVNRFLKENSVLVLIKQYIKDGNPVQETLPEFEEEIYQVYLTDNGFTENIKISSTDNGIKYYDVLRSKILQFSLGGFFPYNTNLLQRARFYYVKGFYDDDGAFVYKPDKFIQWCDILIKDFKKQFLRKYPKEKSYLYSDSAIKWIEEHEATFINGGQQWKAKEDK